MKKAVLWDYGGVIATGPFEQFNHFEAEHGLPHDLIRTINSNNPHDNAWAQLERSEISLAEFDELFAAEAAAVGHTVRGADVLATLVHEVRPEMIVLLEKVKAAGYKVACLTNNTRPMSASSTSRAEFDDVLARFDVVVESSKVGARKPEPQFYETACQMLGVKPHECVFLDDLGINLKPAAAMGMTTIKVTSAAQAIAALTQELALV